MGSAPAGTRPSGAAGPAADAAVARLLLIVGLVGCGGGAPSPTITFFGADVGVVTSGRTVSGAWVQGEVILEWQTRGAGSVRLFEGDLPISVAGCETTVPGSDCVRDGRLAVHPAATTELRLRATRAGGDCSRDEGLLRYPEECAEATRPVAVVPPALASLSTETPEIAPGTDVVVHYRIEGAVGWLLGAVDDGAPGGLAACSLDPAGGAPCRLLRDPDGTVPDAGEVVFEDLEADVRVGVVAVNGAADALGRITPDDVYLDLRVLAP